MSASLRNRVAVTLAVFGAAVSLALATAIYLVSHDLERRLVDETLNAELDDLIERRHRNPQSVPERTATIQAFVVNPGSSNVGVPPQVAEMTTGQHQLSLDDTPYRVAVRDVGSQRFVVLYDVSALQRRDQGFALLLAVSVLLITVISALSGRWLASRVIAPVTELVSRVAQLRPNDPPPKLASEFPWIEIQQLAADFDAYLSRLYAFNERENLFTGDISHELRTPLAVISGATELLLSDVDMDERNQARVARIGRAVAEMSEMTSALLALARAQEGVPVPVAAYDVGHAVGELVERYHALFSHKPVQLHLKVSGNPRLTADRAVLSMVLGNLLRNALSFTSKGSVTVCVTADAIEVHDTGSGIGDIDVAELFQPYMRGHDSEGAGLGLSLVHRLCERHGWHIELTNIDGGGTLARLAFAPDTSAPDKGSASTSHEEYLPS
ncbi:MAG TPA: HAMP domain-containing sensor histidine kinase [Gammaproteobacteria bacterium]|nr:HAMP domain-containing histidine kinase [Gammaproteobacteria bacterium]MCP5439099.1 HAMP domain-containing histidine kinase [Chromatiaceae bacterium]HPQ25658.1 HAMP domain-containing sensor histidine kinase [Gammaproteobacteria bacterium]